jgi:type I restriction enzyme R subunit
MPHPNPDSEDALERATLQLFAALGWQTHVAMYEWEHGPSPLGRSNRGEVVLVSRLRAALQRLNPDLPAAALDLAVTELTRDRGMVSMVQANQQIYRLLRDGIAVTITSDAGDTETVEQVRLIDWDDPDGNDYILVSQFWVAGEIYTRRADLIGFVNGLPLVFLELKAHHRRIELAYQGNLRDYKDTIPQLFWYNALLILSNGADSFIGSITAAWDHFATWKKITSEGEAGIISLETMIRGTCERARLLDLMENFILFDAARGEVIKLVAKNHQFLGVSNAIAAVRNLGRNQGRLGVFWHTQGSGKSYSMVFFAQKILRKLPGNWTFLIVTDRTDLDDQIYKNFANVGAVTEPEEHVRAGSGEHLRELLREDHRYLFTLIQKFRTAGGAPYPQLSDRADIIVITDEAHRSQYDIFAQNMRRALPNAAFIGFTGTPLLAGEEKTREVFGDYVSIYDFKQSIEDRATVPLYYENRIPQLKLNNPDLNADMDQLLDDALVDDAQEERLERVFAKEYTLITDDDRLETIAQDIVRHFLGRGQGGKAMVVSIDKATAVRMYDKVQRAWQQHLADLQARLTTTTGDVRTALEAQIAAMQATDMAVVVSSAQNEVADFQQKGLDIRPHRQRMQHEDLDTKFKDSDDPLRIVFVCAMWMTGFDVPACATIYLDKPMRNHTLMQTIARANRVFRDKVHGLIVDYIGVFRNLQQALAIYATGGRASDGNLPVRDKSVLVEQVRQAINAATDFCTAHGVDLAALQAAQGFTRIKLVGDAVEAIIVNDSTKQRYLALATQVDRLFRAMLPDPAADTFGPARSAITVIAERIRSLAPQADISPVADQVADLLDSAIVTGQYVIPTPLPQAIGEERADYDYDTGHLVDLSRIDFEALRQQFASGRKRTEAEKLTGAIKRKLTTMVQLNRTRMNYLETFQQMIENYNAGASNVDAFFTQLLSFARALTAEEQRTIAENLAEEELALFDLLTRPELTLSQAEQAQVKQIARDLLATLKQEKLVLDWRKKQQAKAAVRLAIEETLDQLPESYTTELYAQKCEAVYQHIYDAYAGAGQSIYTRAA